MSRRALGVALAAVVALTGSAPASASSRDPINAYTVKATTQTLEKLAQAGFDVTEARSGRSTQIFGTAGQVAKLEASAGIDARLIRSQRGRTAARGSRAGARKAQAQGGDAGFAVWRRYDRVAGDGREQYLELYDRLLREKPAIVKRRVLGRTHEGRDIVALKVTRHARRTRDNSRPAVLYSAVQHSREWLAGETCRRNLVDVTQNYGSDPEITRLVDTRELWFVCIANPDGYEYSFTPGNRLWRKNMADNDGDGVRGEPGDGVDPNRNFPNHWGYDDEGSSPDPASEVYRGSGPASEPETKAMLALMERVDFSFQKNDHTAAELILYPEGWQQYTPTADNPIFTALAGDDERPAIEGFDPDLGAELYITNGDTIDTAYHRYDILSYTPEGSEAVGPGLSVFEYPDDEAMVEAEYRRHREFALDLARSAADPDDPISHLGNRTQDFYLDGFPESHGDFQPVEVIAKRALGRVTMRYRVNGGEVRSAATQEFRGGERYKIDDQIYYRRLRGTVTGTTVGDSVEVWFERRAGGSASESFTYSVRADSDKPVLVLAAEDYSGASPDQTGGPRYLEYYTDALEANGIEYDVYDVDARGRRAPDPLGVLSHYRAVIWYTGDDLITREPGQAPGTGTSQLAFDEQIAVRDYLNEGGKLLFSGQHAGRQYANGLEFRAPGYTQPPAQGGRFCAGDEPERADRCLAHSNDFLQYWLGAYTYQDQAGTDPVSGQPFPLLGEGPTFGSLRATLNGEDSAANQSHTASFLPTSAVLGERPHDHFDSSRRLASWDRGGAAAYEPFSGSYFVAAGAHNEAYKRLRREVDLTGRAAAELSFRTSFDLEPEYDYLFVEAREVGTDAWTTLPDANGNTSQDTGLSCPSAGDGSNWQSDHPFLARYQTLTSPSTCTSTGTTGEWHAATGNSGGWQEWRVDLSRFAGKRVELSVSVASDPAFLGLGTWIDDARVSADGTTLAETSFEDDLGGWTAGPPPEGTVSRESGWKRTDKTLEEAAVVGTEDSVYAGFGFEGITGAADRATAMGLALRHLGLRRPRGE